MNADRPSRAADEQRFRRDLLRWRDREGGPDFPWRRTRDAYAVLIGEVLLQRTTRTHVAAVYEEFLFRWPDPERLAAAKTSSIRSVIAPLGLPKRAPMLKRLGAELVALGSVPLDPAQLNTLPGVGPYAAHAVPIFARGRDLPLVDWIIARVLRRYFQLPTAQRPNADPDLWVLAARIAEPGRARDLWLGVLDLGAGYCRATPRCASCPIRRSCRFAASSDLADAVDSA